MSVNKAEFDPRPMPRIESVRAAGDLRIEIKWAHGTRQGRSEIVDLAPLVNQYRFYRPLRASPELFASVRLEDGGETLEWGDGGIDMPAVHVERLAEEQMTAGDFREFLGRNALDARSRCRDAGQEPALHTGLRCFARPAAAHRGISLIGLESRKRETFPAHFDTSIATSGVAGCHWAAPGPTGIHVAAGRAASQRRKRDRGGSRRAGFVARKLGKGRSFPF